MALQAKDLMVDDWVYIKDHPIQFQPQKVKPEHFVRSLVEFEPIPLTPEILEKNGWMKIEADGVFYPKQLKGELPGIGYATDGKKWAFRMRDFCDVEYVHELQHALRLCGITREIII